MARPGKWIYSNPEIVFTTSGAVQANDILAGGSHPVGSTVRRIIGQVDVWLAAPFNSTQNYLMRLAVHQLGAGASLDSGTCNSFPNRFPWWAGCGLYLENWDPVKNRYWARNTIRFDVDGDRKLTSSNTTLRFAAHPTGMPRFDGFWVVTASIRTFVSDPP